jgi:hypothetical protein
MAQNISTTQYEHVITYADGHKRVARLFFSREGNLCEFNKRSRKYGHYFDSTGVVDIEPVDYQSVDTARKFLKRVCKLLEKSGLWANMLHDYKILLSLDDDTLKKVLTTESFGDEVYAMARKYGMMCGRMSGGVDSLVGTIRKGIISIPYGKYKLAVKDSFRTAIKNKAEFNYFWRKNYDNRISCQQGEDGIMRAWFSSEFKDCGNGHYYLAIDESHAIFCEDD